MKQLIKTLQQEENSNKYYYDKMLSDFEMESRYNAIVRSIRNKWRNESLKYIQRVKNMREKIKWQKVKKRLDFFFESDYYMTCG